LKVVQLYFNEPLIIRKAIANDAQAQRAIYEHFAPKMLSVCRQYISDAFFAEDVSLKVLNSAKYFTGKKITKKEGTTAICCSRSALTTP